MTTPPNINSFAQLYKNTALKELHVLSLHHTCEVGQYQYAFVSDEGLRLSGLPKGLARAEMC